MGNKINWLTRICLFIGVVLILVSTAVPTLYSLDSPEFVIGADQLGFIHAPSYPLYLLLLHGFLQLPLKDKAYLGNLFSVLCLAGVAPILYDTLSRLTGRRGISASSTLIFLWSYYIWQVGLFAEIYAPQLLTLAVCLWWVVYLKDSPSSRSALLTGGAFGLAVAIHPASVLFGGGLVAIFLGLKVSWRVCIGAAAGAVIIFLLPLVYFPWRAESPPSFNLLGTYNEQGEFEARDLRQPANILWVLRGHQFDSLFFAEGYLPRLEQLRLFGQWLNSNFLGFGLILGLWGAVRLFQQQRDFLWLWLLSFLPYGYFYLTYGASDRHMMLAPFYLGWAILLAYGLQAVSERLTDKRFQVALWLSLPLLMLVVNYPRLDLSNETSVRDRSEVMLNTIPTNGYVFGTWTDITPLQYLAILEKERPDLTLYNLFLFPPDVLEIYVKTLLEQGQTVFFLSEDAYEGWLNPNAYTAELILVPWFHPDFEPVIMVRIEPLP